MKIDVDQCPNAAAEAGISSVPTFVFMKNGKETMKFSGADEAQLKHCINQLDQ